MGVTVATGAGVEPVEGTAVGAAVAGAAVVGAAVAGAAVVGAAVAGAGKGVAVAEDPRAKITASRRAKGPRMIAFGFFNQWFKTD